MNIKEKIGKRIGDARREAGLTVKQLAEKTAELKPARIGNWEQGTRAPGPLEATLLAEVLGLSPAYLLCLSDDPQGTEAARSRTLLRNVPILTFNQALDYKQQIKLTFKDNIELADNFDRIPIDKQLKNQLHDDTFALHVEDDSMQPEFTAGDLIIADPELSVRPGNYVLAFVNKYQKTILRKYRESENGFELVALNPDWSSNIIESKQDGHLIATVVEHRRKLINFN